MRIINSLRVSLVSLFCVSALAAESTGKEPPSKFHPSGTQMVLVGDAWNTADECGLGFCSKNFLLGAYEWTVQDWKENVLGLVARQVDFTNEDPALQIADPHGLWNKKMERWIHRSGTATKGYEYSIVKGAEYLPITNVNLFDTFRACNIMHRLKKYGPSLGLKKGESFDEVTERGGAYTITTNSAGKQEAYRSVGAYFYICSQSEWVKAAYYKGGSTDAGYWMYPTQHDSPNPGGRDSSFTENKANYNLSPFNSLKLSEVNHCGQYIINDNGTRSVTGTHSFYGCVDMAGNVNEWTTGSVKSNDLGNCFQLYEGSWFISEGENSDCRYIVRGGDFESGYSIEPGVSNDLMRTCILNGWNPNTRSDKIGFRMAGSAEDNVPAEKGFAEKDYSSSWWSNYTTGEQVAMVSLPITVALGAAVGAGIITADALLNGGAAVGGAIDSCFTSAGGAIDSCFTSAGGAIDRCFTSAVSEGTEEGAGGILENASSDSRVVSNGEEAVSKGEEAFSNSEWERVQQGEKERVQQGDHQDEDGFIAINKSPSPPSYWKHAKNIIKLFFRIS